MICKTLIGKNNILFLTNDNSKELEIHCNNINLIQDLTLSQYDYNDNNFFIVVFPDKTIYYKDYLPDEYVAKYRPALDVYKQKFKNKLLDGYDILQNVSDAYYKTDTHINIKGAYEIYLDFINKINEMYKLDIISKKINISVLNNVILSDLKLSIGIGDLTWESNLGDLKLNDEQLKDNFYYSDDIKEFYMRHLILKEGDIHFLDYTLNDKTEELNGQMVDWNIISKYIIYKKNKSVKNSKKIIIFYDSFLVGTLPLYFELFYESWFIKNYYNHSLITLINPDYVFEFRVERFLN
jgi:hypothetical protein